MFNQSTGLQYQVIVQCIDDSENVLELPTKNRSQRAIRCNAALLFALILCLRQVGQSRRHLGSRTGLF